MHCRSARFRKLNAAEISHALDEVPSDSDISGMSDDSDNDETYIPRGEAVPDSSDEDEEPPHDDQVPVPEEEDILDVPEVQQAPVAGGGDQQAKRRRVSGRRVVQRDWMVGDLPAKTMPTSAPKPRGMQGCSYEVSYFMKLFGQNNINLLTEESNRFRAEEVIRRNKNIPAFSEQEIRQTLGILMYMSIVSMPNTRLYWRLSLRNSMVTGVMSRDRFEIISTHLHLCNNSMQPGKDSPEYDRLYKVKITIFLHLQHFNSTYLYTDK